jgi:trehalose synthase-fused probable maltokinase
MGGPDADRDRLSRWLVDELPRHLPGWLVRQRWFGGKARAIARVEVRDVVWLPAAARPVAVVVADVHYDPAGGGIDCWALLLGLADGPAEAAIAPSPGGGHAIVTDQAADGEVVRALLAGLLGDAPMPVGVRGGALVYADTTIDARQALSAAALPVRPLGVEQSNTSVRIGTTHVFKLFRRVEPGEHPQLEFGRFLAQAGFRATPRLEGSLVYRGPDGQESAIGVLESWVANEGDGWHYLLARLDASRTDLDGRADLMADLVALGETTAAFHGALASETRLEAFVPEAASTADAAAWRQGMLDQAERTIELIGQRLPALPAESARLAEAVIASWPRAVPGPSAPLSAPGFDRIRIHGDFHLGQTLRTPGGFVIIDFEGEPAKSLAARRRKQCALKDVAGMLRSLDYAAAAAGLPAGDDAAAFAPHDAMRHAFLEGYYAHTTRHGARFLPAAAEDCDAWTSLFELEKAWYEVEYELNNRPTWTHIPLVALSRLLASAS